RGLAGRGGAGLRLDDGRPGGPAAAGRQAGAPGRGGPPGRPARVLHRPRGRLRRGARPARPGRRRPGPLLGGVRPGRPRAGLQLPRLRAALGGRRGAARPGPGRAGPDRPRRRHHLRPVRGPGPAIVLVVPADRLTGLTGFIDALATVFTVYGPWAGPGPLAAAVAFLWLLVATGLTWVMASARTQAAASLDGIGPVSLGRVSARTGTPLAATLAVGVVATLTTLAAFAVAGDDNGRYFSAALTLSIALL